MGEVGDEVDSLNNSVEHSGTVGGGKCPRLGDKVM